MPIPPLFAAGETEKVLLPLLIQLGVIVLLARLFGRLAQKIGQPAAVGEIAAGLFLGPSLLGRFFPEYASLLFAPQLGLPGELNTELLPWILRMLAQLGLVFLLFLIGLEFDFGHLRWHGQAALTVSLVGIALPFVLGISLTPVLYPYAQDTSRLAFALFLGTALSITALPILGRIMMEWNITRTRIGVISISAAAVDDVVGWILLATVTGIARLGFDPVGLVRMVVESLGFALLMYFVGRPVLLAWLRRSLDRQGGELSLDALAVLLVVLFACAIVTSAIGIFAIFGAFYLGALLSSETRLREAVGRRMQDLVTTFFLPIFFTYTGLRTNVQALDTMELWIGCALVCLAAIVGKLGGCGLAAWASGFSRREAACIGAMMNTRALMELVVINVGLDLGVIPREVFAMLVLMALLTTVMTSPLIYWLSPGTEIDPFIRQRRKEQVVNSLAMREKA